MNLLPSEKVLLKSPGGSLTLTTHRIRYDVKASGSGELISIMLEELASCSVVRASKPVLLIIAAVIFILGLIGSGTSSAGGGAFIAGFVGAIVFVVLYFASRYQVIAFASAGGTIRVNVVSMKMEMIRQFIEEAEAAKNERYLAKQIA